MAPIKLPDLNIGNDSPNDNLKILMQSVKPHWQQEEIQIEKMSGGYSCSSYHCYLTGNPHEGVTVRVKKLLRNNEFASLNEGFEHKLVELISNLEIFPKLLAIFQDGYCYDYIPGAVIINLPKAKETKIVPMFEETNLKKIAVKLATIHLVKMEDEDHSTSQYFPRLFYMMKNYKDSADVPNKKIVEEELQELAKYVDQMKCQVALSHGDFHPGNMILNKQTGEITVIDWEAASIGYQSYDVAYFLKSIAFIDQVVMPEKCTPKETIDKMEEQFLRFYYDEWIQKSEHKIDYATFCDQVKLFKLAYNVLLTAVFGSILLDDQSHEMPMDTVKMMNQLMEEYFSMKTSVLKELKLI